MLSKLSSTVNSRILKPIGLQLVRSSRLPAEYWLSDKKTPRTKRIIFFHPPKCGGTSVEALLQREFGIGEELSPFASRQAAARLSIPMQQLREIILAYQIHRTDRFLVFGHYWFSERLFKDCQDAFDLITILRDPRHRLLSQYYYNRHKPNQTHFGITSDLEEWLDSPNATFHANLYTLMFSGDIAELSNTKNLKYQDLDRTDRAINNLQNFFIIGILEKQKEFEEQLYMKYGIKSRLTRERANTKADYLTYGKQPRHIQEKVSSLCSEDLRLYRVFA